MTQDSDSRTYGGGATGEHPAVVVPPSGDDVDTVRLRWLSRWVGLLARLDALYDQVARFEPSADNVHLTLALMTREEALLNAILETVLTSRADDDNDGDDRGDTE